MTRCSGTCTGLMVIALLGGGLWVAVHADDARPAVGPARNAILGEGLREGQASNSRAHDAVVVKPVESEFDRPDVLIERRHRNSRPPFGPLVDAVNAHLDLPFKIDVVKAKLEDLAPIFEEQGLNFVIHQRAFSDENMDLEDAWFTISATPEMTMRAVLQQLEDMYEIKFVVRDYGLVVTSPTYMHNMHWPAAVDFNLPDGIKKYYNDGP